MKNVMLNKTKHHDSHGDTIVEVLLSITIIAFVLGAAYLLTNRSLQAGIAAREHTEAVNYLQGQIERLKGAKESISKPAFDTKYRVVTPTPAPFCLIVDASDTVSQKPAGDPACFVDPTNSTNGRYHLSIIYISAPAANANTFKFSASWDRIGAGTTESADIYYRASER